MSLSARRHFFVQVLAAGTAATATPARAQARVEETDEQAAALGYRHDTAAVDGRKYPKHETSQHCGNCAFFQGQPSDAWAGCAMFGRKQIAKSGWCMAWAKAPG
jgi:hypothetical protein